MRTQLIDRVLRIIEHIALTRLNADRFIRLLTAVAYPAIIFADCV